jgi:hypothetical protein
MICPFSARMLAAKNDKDSDEIKNLNDFTIIGKSKNLRKNIKNPFRKQSDAIKYNSKKNSSIGGVNYGISSEIHVHEDSIEPFGED